MFTILFYRDQDSSQYGYADNRIPLHTFEEAREKVYDIRFFGFRNEIVEIIFKDNSEYEGFIGSFRYEGTPFNLEDFYIYPDPNYRGNKDNRFWGTIAEYREQMKEQER